MKRRDFLKASLAAAGLASLPSGLLAAGSAQRPEAVEPPVFSGHSYVDCHLHYLDFLQVTDGLERLVEAMNAANVERAVLFGMPMIKQWDPSAPKKPKYYLSNDSRCYYYSGTDFLLLKHLAHAPPRIRSRFIPFICGINANDMNAADLLRRLMAEYPGLIAGIGEIMCRHDDLTAQTYGEPPRPDHPALLPVYDLAAEMRMPVIIHHNISGAQMDEPLYLAEMENALRHNRETNIVWAHVGVSRRVELSNLPEVAEGALQRHSNLYFDLSWLVFENYIAKDEASFAAWADLIARRPGRFMVGTDVVGHWDKYAANVLKYNALLDRLPSKTARMVARDNILGLIGPRAAARLPRPAGGTARGTARALAV
ncbi:amidohydrolase [Desulfovibrio aminophilus]|nr:amidohydrolase family protein [Desulfovibrio aminophilus]MCM0755441.1 amidohydrolase [Desulfovibrio aminophilus]